MKLILFTLFLWNLKPNEGAVKPSLKKENFCPNIICQDEFCEDGSLAPKTPDGCCPDSSLCKDDNLIDEIESFNTTQKDCSAIGCLTELCPNGDIPPTPEGRCCPSALLCPRDNCHVVRCKVDRCSDGSVAPVPVGQCCPDAFYCFDNVDQCSEWECSQPKFCPNGDLAPVPFGECCPNTELCPHKQCDHVTCIPEFCPTGELAPIPLGECCPKSDQCDNSDCSLVRCFVERCQDGTIAPKPLGKCCPSQTMCLENSNQNDVTIEEFLDDVRMLSNNESTEVSDTNFSAKFKEERIKGFFGTIRIQNFYFIRLDILILNHVLLWLKFVIDSCPCHRYLWSTFLIQKAKKFTCSTLIKGLHCSDMCGFPLS